MPMLVTFHVAIVINPWKTNDADSVECVGADIVDTSKIPLPL